MRTTVPPFHWLDEVNIRAEAIPVHLAALAFTLSLTDSSGHSHQEIQAAAQISLGT